MQLQCCVINGQDRRSSPFIVRFLLNLCLYLSPDFSSDLFQVDGWLGWLSFLHRHALSTALFQIGKYTQASDTTSITAGIVKPTIKTTRPCFIKDNLQHRLSGAEHERHTQEGMELFEHLLLLFLALHRTANSDT